LSDSLSNNLGKIQSTLQTVFGMDSSSQRTIFVFLPTALSYWLGYSLTDSPSVKENEAYFCYQLPPKPNL
jgi:hypothetical protein